MRGRALSGGIIAAGEGRRLRADGWLVPKPLVPVAGVPLLEAVIRNFLAADIRPVTIIVNEYGRACVEWSRTRFPDVDLRFIVKTTASSLESFAEVAAADTPGPMLMSTVDAWCRPPDFVRFVAAATARPPAATVLAVTPLVADEHPLWVTLGEGGRVRRLGGRSGDVVTAGLYLIPEALRRLPRPRGHERLRDFLAWLVERGESVYAETIETVVDVDRSSDVALAESLGQEPRERVREVRG
ncbi:MAG: NTP transferase domain-containing protein [Candidatus Rokuibacteriota bacterium]